MSKYIESNVTTLKFLKRASPKVVNAVIESAPHSLIYAFSEIAFNAFHANKNRFKRLKNLASKTTSFSRKRKLLKPLIVKQLLTFFDKHYGT